MCNGPHVSSVETNWRPVQSLAITQSHCAPRAVETLLPRLGLTNWTLYYHARSVDHTTLRLLPYFKLQVSVVTSRCLRAAYCCFCLHTPTTPTTISTASCVCYPNLSTGLVRLQSPTQREQPKWIMMHDVWCMKHDAMTPESARLELPLDVWILLFHTATG